MKRDPCGRPPSREFNRLGLCGPGAALIDRDHGLDGPLWRPFRG
ncbi:MAG: hypothetical protein NZM15_03660 [Flavobacteriales bacterium]|nr:hypothetical protein [Flavobacteriales bacterium]MDW8431782.1 hypothetical protein [Flavobacteriales bacterium]